MEITDWIISNWPFITAFITIIITLYYAYLTRKKLGFQKREMDRPRKEDEVNTILIPLLSQYSGEIEQLKDNRYWFFPKRELFLEKVQKHSYKKIIYQ